MRPIYIKFNCSGDNCNEDFFMVIPYKHFLHIQQKHYRNEKAKEMICCPHCGHVQILNTIGFLTLDTDKYFTV